METSYSASTAHAAASPNDEGPSGTSAQASQVLTQSDDTNRSGETLREQGYPKRLANVTAKLAMLGFELHPLMGQQLIVARWNMSRTLPGVEAAEQFLVMVGGAV